MFGENYQGLRIVVSDSAMRELMKQEKHCMMLLKFWKKAMMRREKEKKEPLKSGLIGEIKPSMLLSFEIIMSL